MSVSVRQFKAAFPEFENTSDYVVQVRLDASAREIQSSVYGAKTNWATMVRTARKLASSTMGEQSRLKAKDRATVYDAEDDSLKRQVTHGLRVI